MDNPSSVPCSTITREHILSCARRWIGTPYVHQACRLDVGCDCLGLLRGVWQMLYGYEAEKPPAYTPVWAEICTQGSEPMLEAADKHLVKIPTSEMGVGDILFIRVRNRSAVKHCGIIAPNNHIIHAYDRHHVVEEPIRPLWKGSNIYAYRFPGVVN